MNIEQTKLKDLVIITPEIHEDERGFFMELYRKSEFEQAGFISNYVQDNQSHSKKDVVRGLHFQWEPMLGKILRVANGSVYAVAVDIRKKSKTLGGWIGVEISQQNKLQLYAPPGFATGFCALSENTDVQYKYSAYYNPKGESNILWNDSDIGIKWPTTNPIVSERDNQAQTFKEWLKTKESDNF